MNSKRNLIAAYCIVSESEIYLIDDKYNHVWFDSDNPNRIKLMNILHELGMNTDEYIEVQQPVLHRNRLNQVVNCGRYVGVERLDYQWISSGRASKEAIDKASGSKLLEELYRAKGLTEDAQLAMEYKDKYSSKGEE